jgi:TPR repeat protein
MRSKNQPLDSPEEVWSHIEEQEDLLNQLENALGQSGANVTLQDPPLSFAPTKLRATQGDPVSQYNLSISYARGEGISQDTEKATYWMLQSAENGFAPAQYNAGCYWRDKEDPDVEVARQWFTKAAKQDFGPAQFNLGILYGQTGNYVAAYAWLYLAEQNQIDGAKQNRLKAAGLLSKEDLNNARLAVSTFMWDLKKKG